MIARICEHCGRPVLWNIPHHHETGTVAYVYVVHEGYGCDTGCCGHRIYAVEEDGSVIEDSFEFSHPYGEPFESFIESLAGEMAARYRVPIRYEECSVYDE